MSSRARLSSRAEAACVSTSAGTMTGCNNEMQAPQALKPQTMEQSAAPVKPRGTKGKLSYNEQREFDALPARIEALEAEQARLQAMVAAPDFYKEPADAIAATLGRVAAIEPELDAVMRRWDELDSKGGKGERVKE